jgi:hypothetical protein
MSLVDWQRTTVTPRPTADIALGAAAEILSLVFGSQTAPWSFRLWDESLVHCGAEPAASVVRFKSRAVCRRLLQSPSVDAFGEAYINGDIDFEGNLFDVMERSNFLEIEQFPWKAKLKLWRLARKI